MSEKVGVIFRSYAKNQELLHKEIIPRALNSARRARDAGFDEILFTVPIEHDWNPNTTVIELGRAFEKEDLNVLLTASKGHHSSDVLNDAVGYLSAIKVTHAAIVSNKAASYLDKAVLYHAKRAIANGARVIGLAIEELSDIIIEGRVQNTFAVWNIKSLMETGGFVTERGVEEMIPLTIHVVRFGRCIAILIPNKGTLEIRKSIDGQARHREVMETKITRQLEEVKGMTNPFAFIRSGIMEGYPLSV